MLNVTVTTEGFDEFMNHLTNMEHSYTYTNGFKRYANRVRDAVILGNPVGDSRDRHRGLMKRSWQRPQYSFTNRELKATVTNTVDYGVAENYGHYQTPGQYVPDIQKTLIHSWVPGTYALETSLDNAELEWEGIIREDVLRIWGLGRTQFYDKPMHELNTTGDEIYNDLTEGEKAEADSNDTNYYGESSRYKLTGIR